MVHLQNSPEVNCKAAPARGHPCQAWELLSQRPGRNRIDSVDTRADNRRMRKLPSPDEKLEESPAVAVAGPAVASEGKATISLRIDPNTRQLIDDAAMLLGKTRTEFMVEGARREAMDVLLDQRLLNLNAEHYDAFLSALDNPQTPGEKLRSLLRRKPAWKR